MRSRIYARLLPLVLLGLPACTGSSAGPSAVDPDRLGRAGETCGRTQDCAAPLRCLAQQCRPEGATASVASTGAFPTMAPAPAPAQMPYTSPTGVQVLGAGTPATTAGVPPAGPGSGPR